MANKTMLAVIEPDWQVAARVKACCTTRQGGFSQGAFATLNPATHVGDDLLTVNNNRERLLQALKLPTEPVWLEQVHSTRVLELCAGESPENSKADAAIATEPGVVCAVMTADCLPVLLCNQQASWVAAVHAGWRGLAGGILSHVVQRYPGQPAELYAWLGPAISAQAYEVGDDVNQAFAARGLEPDLAQALTPTGEGKFHLDMVHAARLQLTARGITDAHISGGAFCTYTDAQRFYSYRRDGTTGRMVSLIWLDAE